MLSSKHKQQNHNWSIGVLCVCCVCVCVCMYACLDVFLDMNFLGHVCHKLFMSTTLVRKQYWQKEATVAYRQLVEMNPVECEVLIVNWIQRSPHYPCLHLMLFFWQQLQFHVGIAIIKKNK